MEVNLNKTLDSYQSFIFHVTFYSFKSENKMYLGITEAPYRNEVQTRMVAFQGMCHLLNIAKSDYQECVNTGQTYTQMEGQTNA